jgi:hypothetical protein
MLGLIAESAARYPTAFGRWLQAADFAVGTVKHVALVGDIEEAGTRSLLDEIRRGYCREWSPRKRLADTGGRAPC